MSDTNTTKQSVYQQRPAWAVLELQKLNKAITRFRAKIARLKKQREPYCPEVMEHFKLDAWGEHPQWGRKEWQLEVRSGDTQRGYWDWVNARFEDQRHNDPEAAAAAV